MRRLGLAVASGVLLAASIPPWDWRSLGWMALVPLFLALDHSAPLFRLLLGLLAGLTFALVGWLPWMPHAVQTFWSVGPVTSTLVTIGAGLRYVGVFFALFALVFLWFPSPRWLSAVAGWILLERLQIIGGAPMGLLGYSQHTFLPFAQVASLVGVIGVSGLLVMTSVVLVDRSGWGLLITTTLALLATMFGLMRPTVAAEGALVHILSRENLRPDAVGRYAAATTVPAALTLWPEAASASYLQESPSAAREVEHAAQRSGGWLLLGTPRYADSHFYNSALLFDPDGHFSALYDKTYLVPWAEESSRRFRTSPRPFTPGARVPLPLVAGSLRLGPLICFESGFPQLAASYARHDADLLVNMTSDRDFGDGVGQHIALAQFRAIETGLWVARPSGVGVSRVIDPHGVVARQDWIQVPQQGNSTFYVRHPDLVPQGAGLVLLGLVVRRWVG